MDILNDFNWYKAFFQTNSSYYIDKVHKYKLGQKFTFNLAALLLGFVWMTYRKMYLEALCLLLFLVMESMIEEYILLNHFPHANYQAISWIMTILISTAIGFTGNYFYIRKAERTIRRALAKEGDTQRAEEYLERKGGTSYVVPVLIIAFLVAWVIVMNSFA